MYRLGQFNLGSVRAIFNEVLDNIDFCQHSILPISISQALTMHSVMKSGLGNFI